ncbi:putative transporter [Peptococcaceae bacterium CEB3]|nr:putative transporter [Peptococcaceae bacterium CEB3]
MRTNQEPLSRRLLWLMAIACALSVANLYYSQPLLADMALTLHVSARASGGIPMLTQMGYALGLFLFVPLGDMKERRFLIVALLFAVALALLGVAAAENLTLLSLMSFLLGATTVVPQLIVPLAVQLAAPDEQGKVVGTVMSGLLFGILLARTVSGLIGQHFGWRAMYVIAAGLMCGLALLLRLGLPESKPAATLSYPQLFRSLRKLFLAEPELREASVMGGLLFGAFSAFWTTLVFFLRQPPYHLGAQGAGLFGLAGVAGAAAAPLAGRLADRKPRTSRRRPQARPESDSARRVAGIAVLITLLAFALFTVAGKEIWGLILGVILLDLGVQSTQISNQARIYRLRPDAKNRLNTVYMVTYFLGGALGSWLGSFAWSAWRWTGVSTAGSTMVLLSLAVWALGLLPKHPAPALEPLRSQDS